jgi:hypothetical protein
MYRKLCFYRFEKLRKYVILESGGFSVIHPRNKLDGKQCIIIPLRFVKYKV